MKAVVQLRGEVNMSQEVQDTLGMLNVTAVNHCSLVPETDTYQGMLTKVTDYVAMGEPSADVLATLIRRRGEPAPDNTSGDDRGSGTSDGSAPAGTRGPVDDEWVAQHTAYGDVDELAEALLAEETTLRDQGLAPVLRLHPPRGGHDGIKKHSAESGQLGQHSTQEIDTLLEAMR